MANLHHIQRLDITDRGLLTLPSKGASTPKCRHLLSLLQRFVTLSHQEAPRGSLPAFAGRDIALPAQRLSRPLQLGIRFLHDPLPAPPTTFLTVCLPQGQRYGLTMFRICDTRGVGSASLPTILCVHVFPFIRGITDRMPFGPSLSAPLACCW